MRLFTPNSASLLLPALTFTATAFESTALPPSTSATPTPTVLPENRQLLVPYWSPISTITTHHLASPTTNTNPHDSETDPDRAGYSHDLLRRQAAPVTAPAAAAPSNPLQLSPITTMQVEQLVNGVAQQVQVVYTQLFSAVPDQGAAPAVGSIGLGTIVGQVGVVKTAHGKREAEALPTGFAGVQVEKRVGGVEEGVVGGRERGVELNGARGVERRSVAGKVDANSMAESALALLIAVAVMVVV